MLKPGDHLDRYVLEDVVGQGGMGCVYRAHDARLDRRVAIKVVLADDLPEAKRAEATARLLREARVAAALDHPNATHIYDVGEAGDTTYIVMELVPGRTLRAFVGDRSIAVRQRIRWLVEIARALAAAHDAGLVHRDVKPENVMVRPDGHVKVLDFGIARRVVANVDPSAPTEASSWATLTAQGVPVGTPMYMAPEQIRGDVLDARADQFAFGVVAYELLTGKVPWAARDPLGLVAAIMTGKAAPLSVSEAAVPSEVDRAVIRALEKSAADRFPSMHPIVAVLEASLGESAPSLPPPSPVPKGAGGAREYTTQEVREILGRAVERQEHPGLTATDLIDAARQVGIDEHDLRSAMADLERDGLVQLPDRRQREKQRLMRHVAMWAVFSLFFFLLGKTTGSGHWWVLAVLGWGVGVAAQAVKYLFPVEPSPKRRDRKARRQRQRDPAFERDVEQGVSLLLTAAKDRVRVADGARRRVRVDAPAAVDAEAELESQPEARAAKRRSAPGA